MALEGWIQLKKFPLLGKDISDQGMAVIVDDEVHCLRHSSCGMLMALLNASSISWFGYFLVLKLAFKICDCASSIVQFLLSRLN